MKFLTLLTFGFTLIVLGFAVFMPKTFAVEGVLETQGQDLVTEKPESYPIATLAGGCFWCLESEIRSLDGVLYTRVGYIGGHTKNPTYQTITTGLTGHAEAVEITFDPEKISYEALLDYFFRNAHNPTQLNRQGVDVGTQYRSDIFYHSAEQMTAAQAKIDEVNAAQIYSSPIVTKISPATTFWTGEEYHQQYYEKFEKDKGRIHPRVLYKRQAKKLKGE